MTSFEQLNFYDSPVLLAISSVTSIHMKTNISLKVLFNTFFFFRELQMALEQEKAQKRANLMKFSTRYVWMFQYLFCLSNLHVYMLLESLSCDYNFYINLSCILHVIFLHRHSRFGGTYVVQNMKSISDRDVIFHKNQKDVSNLTFDINKKPKKKAKNRQPIKEQELTRRSTLSIRLGLKEFCVQFLESCYNPLMYAVKVLKLLSW